MAETATNVLDLWPFHHQQGHLIALGSREVISGIFLKNIYIRFNLFFCFLGPNIGIEAANTDSNPTTGTSTLKGGGVTTGPQANAAVNLEQNIEKQLLLIITVNEYIIKILWNNKTYPND